MLHTLLESKGEYSAEKERDGTQQLKHPYNLSAVEINDEYVEQAADDNECQGGEVLPVCSPYTRIPAFVEGHLSFKRSSTNISF